MAIEFSCSSCSKVLRVSDETAGKVCKCPGCGSRESIPKLGATPPINKPSISVSSTDDLVFTCPKCNHLFKGKPDLQGKKGKCNACNSMFTIELRRSNQAVPTNSNQRTAPIATQSVNPLANVWDTLNIPVDSQAAAARSQSGSSSHNTNPYASSSSAAYGSEPSREQGRNGSAEQIRRYHIGVEHQIKSYGMLFLVGGVFSALGSFGYLIMAIVFLSGVIPPPPNAENAGTIAGVFIFVIAAIMGLSAGLYIWIGAGLRSFNSAARIGGIVVSALGLIAFPFGTVIYGFLLYFLLCEKGAFIFSPQYKRIVKDTPHVKYQMPLVVKVILGTLFAVVVILVLGAIILSQLSQ